jgi:hypothetical protein
MGSGQYPLSPLAPWLSFSHPHSLWPSFPQLLSFLRPHFISFLYLPSFLAGGVIAFVVVWPCSVRRLIVKETKAYQQAQEAPPPDLVVVVAATVAVMVVGGIVIVVVALRNDSRGSKLKIINKHRHMLFGSVYTSRDVFENLFSNVFNHFDVPKSYWKLLICIEATRRPQLAYNNRTMQ